MSSRLLRVLQERSDTTLLLLVLPPFIVQAACGLYFGWPPMASPITQPLDEVAVTAAVAGVVALVTTLPALVELRRRYLLEPMEEGEDAA